MIETSSLTEEGVMQVKAEVRSLLVTHTCSSFHVPILRVREHCRLMLIGGLKDL